MNNTQIINLQLFWLLFKCSSGIFFLNHPITTINKKTVTTFAPQTPALAIYHQQQHFILIMLFTRHLLFWTIILYICNYGLKHCMLGLNLACLLKTPGQLFKTLHSCNSLQLLHKTYVGWEALGIDGTQSQQDQDRDIYCLYSYTNTGLKCYVLYHLHCVVRLCLLYPCVTSLDKISKATIILKCTFIWCRCLYPFLVANHLEFIMQCTNSHSCSFSLSNSAYFLFVDMELGMI